MLVFLVVTGSAAVVLLGYGAYLINRFQLSAEAVTERARTVETTISPALVFGPNGRAFDAALEIPILLRPSQIPDFVKAAFTTREDRRFWMHPGLDPFRLFAALWENGERFVSGQGRKWVGASTITMQLVKNLLLNQEQTLGRKFDELLLAIYLEVLFTKDEILAMYLNNAYFGDGAYGIEAAARKFFGKSVGYKPQIDRFEAALLAVSVQRPSEVNPGRNRHIAEREARALLQRMALEGAAGDATTVDPDERERGPRSWDPRPFVFRDVALRQLLPDAINQDRRELVHGFTLDSEAQMYAEREAARLLELARPRGYDSSIVIVMERDGAILAIANGHPYDGKDVVGFGRVAPGSTLKPFLYLCALENGMRPSDEVHDVRREFTPGWRPRNADGKYLGTIPLSESLIRSRNPVAVELFLRFGPECFSEVLARFGIILDNPEKPASVLGSETVSLLSLAAAYASLSQGQVVAPYAVRYARTLQGEVVFRHRPTSTLPVSRSNRAHCDLLSMLRGVTSSAGTGHNAAFDHPVWGKTGTDSSDRSSLFVGFTGRYVAVVWLGRQARGAARQPVSASDLPAIAFRRLMATLHDKQDVVPVECALEVARN